MPARPAENRTGWAPFPDNAAPQDPTDCCCIFPLSKHRTWLSFELMGTSLLPIKIFNREAKVKPPAHCHGFGLAALI
jgi:hypothetical protein